jgi:putative FmdB family regulatory protein
MPLYSYKCNSCGTEFDEFRPVEKRKSCPCEACGKEAKQQLTAAHIDYLGMGTSPSNPTAYDKWAKIHEKRAKEKTGDQ